MRSRGKGKLSGLLSLAFELRVAVDNMSHEFEGALQVEEAAVAGVGAGGVALLAVLADTFASFEHELGTKGGGGSAEGVEDRACILELRLVLGEVGFKLG